MHILFPLFNLTVADGSLFRITLSVTPAQLTCYPCATCNFVTSTDILLAAFYLLAFPRGSFKKGCWSVNFPGSSFNLLPAPTYHTFLQPIEKGSPEISSAVNPITASPASNNILYYCQPAP